ncbi:MAG TPA: sigma-54-dependent Fis family transcriptional regulator, partial [Sporomusaceae bacterium]|nr:sigma-54-dependent Fis family transcriptional regulator [Sporomusaceae bacterium]
IEKVADSNLAVLITGETGTGKEVFANAVHQLSNRRYGNFIKVNCAAIPKDLLESELFGYNEGAFSGASKGGKVGKFEQANNGTILLDEIGELPLPLQSKLLRILQEQEIERIGGVKPVSLDVRIICCTNQNIEQMISEGKFRQDLYYRI